MKFKSLLFILFIIPVVTANSFELESTSHAKLQIEKQSYTVTNTTYKVIPYYPNGNARRMLIEQTTTLTENVGKEGRIAFTNLKAYDVFFGDSTRLLWEIEDYGEEVEIIENYVKFISHGCCSALPTYIYYDLISGKYLMQTTSQINRLYENSDKQEYIGFYEPDAYIRDTAITHYDSLLVAIYLITQDSKLHVLEIYKNNREIELLSIFDIIADGRLINDNQSQISLNNDRKLKIFFTKNRSTDELLKHLNSPEYLLIPYSSIGFELSELDNYKGLIFKIR